MQLLRNPRGGRRRAFTLTEMLIVIGVIVVLLGLLLTTLGGVWSAGAVTKSMNRMRQIAAWLPQYSADHNDVIVPSRFDRRDAAYKGKVRSVVSPGEGNAHTGTWSDILQSVFAVSQFPDALVDPGVQNDYRHDSPDLTLYELLGNDIENPFRSAAANLRNWNGQPGTELPKPFGNGAQQRAWPGLFAANNFFDAGWDGVTGTHFSNGQIRSPNQAMYLVDSFVGETIDADPLPFDEEQIEVDFRYGGDSTCLMLFLDGHSDQESRWESLCELEGDPDLVTTPGRGVRVRNLDQKKRAPCD